MTFEFFPNGFPAFIKRYKRTTSTNDLAFDCLTKEGEKSNGGVFIAEHQENGRGRLGRSWFSKKGNSLLMSFIVVPSDNFKWNLLPLATGLACSKAVEKYKKIKIGIKWPNDIVFNSKKMGGILSESKTVGNQIVGVVVGIGLNIKGKKEDFPDEILNLATTLEEASSSKCEVEEFQKHLFKEIPDALNLISAKDGSFIRELSKYLIHRKGDPIEISSGEKTYCGTYEKLNEDGEIVILTNEGVKSFNCGEITKIRGDK